MSEADISRGAAQERVALRRESLGRLLGLKVVLLACFLAVVLRLIHIQIIDSAVYQEIARRQYEAKVVLPATRGNLYDRNGTLLVSNMMLVSLGADPKMLDGNADLVAERLASVLEKPRHFYLSKLNTSDRHFVWLERRIRPQYAKRISVGGLDGIVQLNEPQRLYHYDHLAGQLIGFTDIDNRGLSGIELALDKQLGGTNGYVIMQRDGLGRKRPSVDYPNLDAVNGHSAVLTIDIEYQAIAEDELRRGVELNKADGGLVLMMDPATGEVLAMAQYPPLNPNQTSGINPAVARTRSITDMFEPGSIFKIVTAAAALERHVVKPDQKFFAEQGEYTVRLPDGSTRKITDTHRYGMLTFREAMEVSSNIVMAKVSDLIGAEALYTTARNFGFGTETGVDLPGEVSGELKKPSRWSGTTLNTMAYGYEVGVTPVQIAAAYSAVANHGVLMKPFVVRQILDDHQQVVEETRPQAVRRVVSASTAELLSQFFEGVIERGTGTPARARGLRSVGKTGTSRMYVDGKYETGNYTASFAGFFPADDPKVVCLVMLDHPRGGKYTGGTVSAPIFKEIAEKVYATSGRFTRRPSTVLAESKVSAVPDVRTLKADAARTMLSSRGFQVEVRGKGPIVQTQVPAPGVLLSANQRVTLVTNEADRAVPPGYTIVPDVRRMTMRRAINSLSVHKLDVDVVGSGIVVVQSPAAGQQVKAGTRVVLRCEPRNLPVIVMH